MAQTRRKELGRRGRAPDEILATDRLHQKNPILVQDSEENEKPDEVSP
jgi:hypothetical protein